MQVNTEKTELALKAVSNEINTFIIDAKAEVEALKAEYGDLVPIANTSDGYDHCKQVRKDLMPIKTKLENARKTLKAPILDAGKLIDSTLKPLVEAVESLYKPFELAYRAVDEEKKNREAMRQEKIQAGFANLDNALVSAAGSTSTVIEAIIDELADFSIDRNVFMEQSDLAAVKHSEVMQRLSEMLMQSIQHEEIMQKQADMERREAEMLKRENEQKEKEQQEANRIEQEKRSEELKLAQQEAAKQAKIEAQAQHEQELEQQKELARLNAERLVKEERERQALEVQQLEQQAAEREANKQHKAKIHNEALIDLQVLGLTESQCKNIVKLIAQGKVRNISIKY